MQSISVLWQTNLTSNSSKRGSTVLRVRWGQESVGFGAPKPKMDRDYMFVVGDFQIR